MRPWNPVSANDANDQRPRWTGDVENGPVMPRIWLAPSSGSNTSAAFTAFLHPRSALAVVKPAHFPL